MESLTLTGNPNLVSASFDMPPDLPMQLFQKWMAEAERLKIIEPRGLILSTVNSSNKPSSRVVLLKSIDNKGVVFATSSKSQKGKDLENNAFVAGTLWWRETMQQINFQGCVMRLSDEISDAMFKERPRAAQAVASILHQSAPMVNEKSLRKATTQLVQKSNPISRPKTWYAYHIAIEDIEFWHGNKDRFHNRLRYTLKNGSWRHQKIQP